MVKPHAECPTVNSGAVCGHTIPAAGAVVEKFHPVSYGGFIRFCLVLTTVSKVIGLISGVLYKGYLFLFVSFKAKYIS